MGTMGGLSIPATHEGQVPTGTFTRNYPIQMLTLNQRLCWASEMSARRGRAILRRGGRRARERAKLFLAAPH